MGLRVLSLFDGMSCGQIALRQLGIPVEAYYASEVDKDAISVTQANFPDTIQLGDVRGVDVDKLGRIDLLLGGSPCQDFSSVGTQRGMVNTSGARTYNLAKYLELKTSGTEFVGQSFLFWEYVRILMELRDRNPHLKFLLENVRMRRCWEEVINHALGLRPVMINSARVSAQNRHRNYWSNIRVARSSDGYLVTAIPQPMERGLKLRDVICEDGGGIPVRERYLKKTFMRFSGKIAFPPYDKKACCLLTHDGTFAQVIHQDGNSRYLNLVERRLLQTIPDWYRMPCSKSKAEAMLGNGWTVEVIMHILRFLE